MAEVVRRNSLEGFFATPTTEHTWFNYSFGCSAVTIYPDSWVSWLITARSRLPFNSLPSDAAPVECEKAHRQDFDMTYYDQVAEAAEFLRGRLGGLAPRVGIVLGSGLGAVADAVAEAGVCALRRDSALSAIDGRGALGTDCCRAAGRRAGRGDAGPRSLLRGLHAAAGDLSDARAGHAGSAGRGADQCGGRHPAGLPRGPACGAGGPHQPDGLESADGAERAALCHAQGRGAALLRHDGGVQQTAARAGEGGRGGGRVRAGRGRLPGDAGAEL